MEHPRETVNLGEIRLIGATLRTSNARAPEIGEFWQRLFADDLFGRIPNRASDDTYSVYMDYESDHTGEYTLLAGCPVSSLDEVPDGMTSLVIAPARYARITLPAATPDAVVEAWKAILP